MVKIRKRKLFNHDSKSNQNKIEIINDSSLKDSSNRDSNKNPKLEDGECCLPCIGVPCCPII